MEKMELEGIVAGVDIILIGIISLRLWKERVRRGSWSKLLVDYSLINANGRLTGFDLPEICRTTWSDESRKKRILQFLWHIDLTGIRLCSDGLDTGSTKQKTTPRWESDFVVVIGIQTQQNKKDDAVWDVYTISNGRDVGRILRGWDRDSQDIFEYRSGKLIGRQKGGQLPWSECGTKLPTRIRLSSQITSAQLFAELAELDTCRNIPLDRLVTGFSAGRRNNDTPGNEGRRSE